MGYRDDYFKANKGKKKLFRKERYYKCVSCGGWFTKSEIDVDHRIPKRKGGTDDLWNLQAMCRHCNRSKNKNQTAGETLTTLFKATANGDLHKAIGGIAKQKAKDVVGIKYKR